MSGQPVFVGPLIHLRTLPHFEGVPQTQLSTIAHESAEALLRRGSVLFESGEPATSIYMMMDGFVEVGGPGPSSMVGPGGVVGFLESLAGAAAIRQVRAETDLVALRLDIDALRTICEQSFSVLGALLQYVARCTADSLPALMASVAGRPEAWAADEELRLDRVGRILALNRSPIFPSSGMDALAELAGQLQTLHLERGTALWEAGEVPRGFYLICRGSVEVAGGGDAPRTVGQGGVPGLVSSLADQPARAGARAAEDSIVLYAGVETLLDVFEDHFEMAFGFLGLMAANVMQAEAKAGD